MAGGQSWANRAGAARQGREGKTGSGGHHRFQQEQTPGATAAPVPRGRRALGRSVCPSRQQCQPNTPQTRTMPSARPSRVPRVRSQERAGHSSPPESILLCLRPRQLLPQETTHPGDVSCTSPMPADCASVPLTSDPESKRQGRSCPNSPRGPASQRAEYKLAKKSSNSEYYKCSLYFRKCGSGHWVP